MQNLFSKIPEVLHENYNNFPSLNLPDILVNTYVSCIDHINLFFSSLKMIYINYYYFDFQLCVPCQYNSDMLY